MAHLPFREQWAAVKPAHTAPIMAGAIASMPLPKFQGAGPSLFGPLSATTAPSTVWPVVTTDPNRFKVAYEAKDGTIVDNVAEGASAPRYFGAPREHGVRRHAGIDLVIREGDAVVSMDRGRVLRSIGGYVGLDAVVVAYPWGNVVYGEIRRDPALVDGAPVEPGAVIGRGARSSEGTMLHFEVWTPDVVPTAFTPWYAAGGVRGVPRGLTDPTIPLVLLAHRGERVTPPAPAPTATSSSSGGAGAKIVGAALVLGAVAFAVGGA